MKLTSLIGVRQLCPPLCPPRLHDLHQWRSQRYFPLASTLVPCSADDTNAQRKQLTCDQLWLPLLCACGAASAGLFLVYRGRCNCLPVVELLWPNPAHNSCGLNAPVLVSGGCHLGVFSDPLFSHRLDSATFPSSVPSALSSAQHRAGLKRHSWMLPVQQQVCCNVKTPSTTVKLKLRGRVP